MVARMKKAFLLLLLTGCASAPAPERFIAAADSRKGELLAAGIVLVPLCPMFLRRSPLVSRK